ncbi:MAG: hypothetical protein CVT98_06820 [Bacteroidetes bacterium HGW-Bacteroidetes-15]|nr:MAG: hypothetical protein CVT98_06820 [Bacteroidetes bacterium HGW-Bacteroidetes-15]
MAFLILKNFKIKAMKKDQSPMKIITYLQIITILVGIIISTIYYNRKSSDSKIEITNLVLTPINPSEEDTVTISVDVNNPNSIKYINLIYKVDSDSSLTIEMKRVNDHNTFFSNIGPTNKFSSISFIIESETIEGQKIYFPSSTEKTKASFTIKSNS